MSALPPNTGRASNMMARPFSANFGLEPSDGNSVKLLPSPFQIAHEVSNEKSHAAGSSRKPQQIPRKQ